ncbi:glycosyltransferase family 2 protein [Chryseobacterium sp. SN22]|uniref:glycosyltransferase family 2 protein n=1 Tax=Chryseobacterium sp. SN22 TaxID=2606431 RepID=UPI0011EF0229|nr:glycosyltransferase family 2 protein [Chryseobacterium sp. SN22]KAA0126160.1 glycosyltransferase family 2 protein [Chryseobacterium sp. SN22]
MIYSIIVLYNPESNNLANIEALLLQSDTLIVIDNSTRKLPEAIADLIDTSHQIVYLSNNGNIGLSLALNKGIKKALEFKDCGYIALFDQDSLIQKDFFQPMIEVLENKSDIIATSPEVVDMRTLEEHRNADHQETYEVPVIITSGSFCKRDAFEKVGLMDETLFIDYIDYEWCFRARDKGYRLIRVPASKLLHNMGEKVVKFLFIEKPYHTNGIRHFYIFRNQMYMFKRNYIPLGWKVTQIFKFAYRIPSYILLSPQPLQTAKHIMKGIKAGFKKEGRNYRYDTI